MWIVSYCGTHRANSQPFGDWEVEKNGTDERKGRLQKRQSLVRTQPLAWKKKRFLCNLISHVPVTLTLSRPWMRAHLEIIVCKFGRNRAICRREEANFVPSQKCPYHVTFDIDLDLEHTLDARSAGDHRVQVWSQSSHLSRSRSDLRNKFRDGRTDRQTIDAARLYWLTEWANKRCRTDLCRETVSLR